MTRAQWLLFETFLIVGLILLGSGIYDEFGAGWCKITVGVILFFGTVFLLLRPTDDSTSDTP